MIFTLCIYAAQDKVNFKTVRIYFEKIKKII